MYTFARKNESDMHTYSNTKMPAPKCFDAISKSEFDAYCDSHYAPFVIKGFECRVFVHRGFGAGVLSGHRLEDKRSTS